MCSTKRRKIWTENQKQRATLLFEPYSDLKKAYEVILSLSHIFENANDKLYGLARPAKCHEKVRQSGFKAFNTVAGSIQNHYETILNRGGGPLF